MSFVKKIRLSKTGRLFQNIFLVLLLMLLCMLAYMAFFTNQFVVKAQTRELDRSNLQVLEQANESLLQLTADLEQQVRLFLSDQTVSRYLLSSAPTGSDESMRILQDMKNYVELTPDVSRLWIYAPQSDTVLSSDGYLTTRAGSQAAGLLEEYEGEKVPRCAQDLRLSAVIWEDELYFLVEFVPARSLGCFVFRMDIQRLEAILGQGPNHIQVAGPDGSLILDGAQLVQSGERFDLAAGSLYYMDPALSRNNQQRYYRLTNEILGWNLLMEIQNGPELYDFSGFWAAMLPFLAVLVAGGAVGAYFITRKIYTPINRLLSLVMDHSHRDSPPAGETDYLEAAYQQTMQDMDQLRSKVSLLGRDLRRSLCAQAIRGQLSERDDAQSVQRLIPEGRFQAVLVRIGDSPVELQAPIRQKLQASALANLSEQIPECLCCLDGEGDTVVLVLCLPLEEDPGRAVRIMDRFTAEASRQTQCPLIYGLGGCCDSLSQLNSSYEQAVRDLQYSAYLAEDPDHPAARSQSSKAREQRLRQVVDQALQSQDDGNSQALAIVQAAELGARSEEDRLLGYRQAQSLLWEKLMVQDEALQSLRVFDPDVPGENTREEFLDFCRQALELNRAMAGKKKYRYVDEAKKYMQENYTNCSLGANDISAHVGISPSYFSSLFNEVVHESVISYLNRIRVEQAKNMLVATRISVKEIGFWCGFNSASVFGRVFKKYTGQSPKQFREEQTGEGEEKDRG